MMPDLRVALQADLLECRQGEVRRISLLRTWVNKGSVLTLVPSLVEG
jgi:hypothetical protein